MAMAPAFAQASPAQHGIWVSSQAGGDGRAYHLRLDDQVKVRGYRVEPGEVEAQLLADPAVRQAVVLARGERLVAYVVSGTSAPRELRSRLAATLPPYLVPDAWMVLNELPLTAHGKVDRDALLALPLHLAASSVATAYTAPRTGAETLVVSVLAEVLGLAPARIGAFDDFFALGGHSLSAIRVIARLRAAAGVEIPHPCPVRRPLRLRARRGDGGIADRRNGQHVGGGSGRRAQRPGRAVSLPAPDGLTGPAEVATFTAGRSATAATRCGSRCGPGPMASLARRFRARGKWG
jgi:hypothetical protein